MSTQINARQLLDDYGLPRRGYFSPFNQEELEDSLLEMRALRAEARFLKEKISSLGCLMCDGSERISVPIHHWQERNDDLDHAKAVICRLIIVFSAAFALDGVLILVIALRLIK